jgi:hypothetical protein
MRRWHQSLALRNAGTTANAIICAGAIASPLFPNHFDTLKDVGLGMINHVIFGYGKKTEVIPKEIIRK